MKRAVVALMTLVAASMLAAGCGGSDAKDEGNGGAKPLKIGIAVGKTGLMEPFDIPPARAAQLAIDDLNKQGGIDGRRIEVLERDTKSEPEEAANAAIELLGEGAELIVTSCDFDFGGPSAVEAQKQNRIGFSTCGASTKFGPTGIGPLAFTMATAAPGISSIMAEWAYEDRGWRRGALLQDTSISYSKQVGEGFEKRWADLTGGKGVVAKDTFRNDDQSIASQVSNVKAANPDFVFLASYQPGIVKALRQIRAGGIDVPVLAAGDLDGDYWKDAVPGVSDVYYAYYGSIYGDDPDDDVNRFIDRYKESYGQPDTASLLTGYSVIQAFARAVERAGTTDGDKVAAELQQFSAEPLLVGPTTFGPELHIDRKRESRIMEIQDGKTRFLKLWAPKDVPEVKG